MSMDVYRRDQICYVNEINRKGSAGRLLRSGYIIFSRTPIVAHLKNQISLDFLDWFFTHEYIIDLTRIQVCLEHYLKAKLLLNGFIVHKPKESSKILFNEIRDKKTKLILIRYMLQKVSFVYDDTKEYNHIPELSELTLGFKDMIGQESIHKIPKNILEILEKSNRIRNMLHFTEAQPENFDASILKEVVDYVETDVRKEINELANELNIPNLRI